MHAWTVQSRCRPYNISTVLCTVYAGYLDSAFFVGGLSASILWTRLSDRWGRKPIIICGLTGALFAALAFGLSVNYPMAMTVRFFWGALDGNMGVVKTLMGDITHGGNQALAYSIMGAVGGTGRFTGPKLPPSPTQTLKKTNEKKQEVSSEVG